VSRSPVPLVVKAGSRDHGLRRVRGATGWIAALAAAGGFALAGGYAVALPGKAYSRVASTNTGSGQSAFGQPAPPPTTPAAAANHPTAAAGPRHATSGHKHRAHALQPPAQAPTPAQAPPATVSGAS
jgi:hypothetical protein